MKHMRSPWLLALSLPAALTAYQAVLEADDATLGAGAFPTALAAATVATSPGASDSSPVDRPPVIEVVEVVTTTDDGAPASTVLPGDAPGGDPAADRGDRPDR